MSLLANPFAKSKAKAGEGEIVLSLLPPGKQLLTTFEYQYPLKLISPDPHKVTVATVDDNVSKEVPVTTVFLLTYGGGLLASDSINLVVTLEAHTRLALLTQGSTKIFKADSNTKTSTTTPLSIAPLSQSQVQKPTSQTLNVKISPHAALVYIPDPNQPYAQSIYEQRQTFYVDPHGSSSLLFLDWVSEGRSARGERWTLTSWKGRNEVREFDETSKGRLLIRDALLLFGDDLMAKTDGKGILGTLVIYGPMFKKLSDFFMKEFKNLPRIGAMNWKASTPKPKTPVPPKTPTIAEVDEAGKGGDYFNIAHVSTPKKLPRKAEEIDGLLWTAAQVRGFVLVKFGAKEVDGARRWLGEMLKREGSVEREFGHQALLCLR